MTFKDTHKRVERSLDKAMNKDRHYFLLMGEVNKGKIDMQASACSSPLALAEMLLEAMISSSETTIAVLSAAKEYMDTVNKQEMN